MYQQAYDNYLSGVSQKLNQLSVLGQLEGQNYDVYNSEQNYRQNSQLMNQENAQAMRIASEQGIAGMTPPTAEEERAARMLNTANAAAMRARLEAEKPEEVDGLTCAGMIGNMTLTPTVRRWTVGAWATWSPPVAAGACPALPVE